MSVVLFQPPAADPTLPPHGLARLAGHLRERGHPDVRVVDLSLGFFLHAFRRDTVEGWLAEAEALVGRYDDRGVATPAEAAHYGALARALLVGPAVAERVQDAVEVFRSAEAFAEPDRYERAHRLLAGALRVANAVGFPAMVGLHGYNPLVPLTVDALRSWLDGLATSRDPVPRYLMDAVPALLPADLDLAGISVLYKDQLALALALARLLREHRSGAVVVLGGSMMGALDRRVGALLDGFGCLDAVVVGEGEDALERLCIDRVPRPGPNTWTRSGPPTALVARDLRDLSPPAYDALPLRRYLVPEPVVPVYAARGCYWGRCAYCAHHVGGPHAPRPVGAVLDEVVALHEGLGARTFYFTDDAMTPAFLRRFSRAVLDRGLRIRWFGDARPEDLDPPTVRLGAEAGLVMLFLGVESASPALRRRMGRGGDLARVDAVVDACHEAGVMLKHNLVFGFPGETEEDAALTLAWLRRRRVRADLVAASPYLCADGSPLADRQVAPGDLTLESGRPAPLPAHPLLAVSTWRLAELSRTHRVLNWDRLQRADFTEPSSSPPALALPLLARVRLAPGARPRLLRRDPVRPDGPLAERAYVSNELSLPADWAGQVALLGLSPAAAAILEGIFGPGATLEEARQALGRLQGEGWLETFLRLGILELEPPPDTIDDPPPTARRS